MKTVLPKDHWAVKSAQMFGGTWDSWYFHTDDSNAYSGDGGGSKYGRSF